MRVLIVEDHTDIADLLRDVLDVEGIDATVRRTDFLGLLADDWARYDVLLCDLMLPGVSGAAICAAARKRRPDIRIVMLTALEARQLSPETWLQIKAIANTILTKPCPVEAIVRAVRGA